ncbi:MAG: YraN family protein, partial [Candidatus Omnitrophica bacterium]|nr:YraN family protein [Candidatus Omnitrophota bacterium]
MILRNNQSLGFLGETAAASYLISQGYKILERNFKKRYGEIDIVALDRNTL